MKIYPLGNNCSMQTDGRTDRQTDDEAKSRFPQCCELS